MSEADPSTLQLNRGVSMIAKSKFLIVYALLGVTAIYIHFHSNTAVPVNKPFSEFPVENKGWRMVAQADFTDRLLDVLKPTDYLYRQYVGPDGSKVELYMGYHDGGKDSGEIHSPKHCLPGSGWYEVSTVKREIAAPDKRIRLAQAVYEKGYMRKLFLYWFQIRGKTTSDEYSLKLSEIMNSLFHNRSDATFVRIAVSFDNDQNRARVAGERFIRDFDGVIQSFLPI
jgi:EpsI family protein